MSAVPYVIISDCFGIWCPETLWDSSENEYKREVRRCLLFAPYLRECLGSVLAQTCTDWEAICVDDGSTDGSGAILDEYAARDGRFKVIHQSNAGVSAARNAALNVVCGEWVYFLDADDLLVSMALATFVVASSFHGTAFAINFNRQFLTITPGAFSSRISSLLELTGLQKRRINGVSDLNESMISQIIEYKSINKLINYKKEESLRFIHENI